MNYQLSNRSTSSLQTLSRDTWSRILSLALFYGWKPMGTLPPFIHNLRKPSEAHAANDWDGTYLRNEGQVVRGEDALALAVALRMSLDDIADLNLEWEFTEADLPDWLSPEEKVLVQKGLEHLNFEAEDDDESGDKPSLGILPFEYFAGDEKQNLVEFIHFCMMGEFVIS
jgi:hypothetical protein